MSIPTTPVPEAPFTIGTPEFSADPLGHYAWLRENAPLARTELVYGPVSQPIWILSRYRDCRAMLTDPRLPRSPAGGAAIAAGLPEHLRLLSTESLIMKDDPEHKRLRTLVSKPFTPRMTAQLGERVRELANDRLDALTDRDVVDLRQDFALPIPYTVISEMVGVAEADRPRFQDGVAALLSDRSAEGWDEQVGDLITFTRDLVARKRSAPGDDILTGLIQAEQDGDRLTEDEVVAMVFTLVIAGYETTYNLITNAVVTLLDHPDQMTRLRQAPDDEGLWRSAIEEIVRFCGPVGGTKPATAAEDIDWDGRTIPAGSTVMPLLGSANRDPEAFDAPDRFDITRSPNHHLGFGYGAHFCLGANLARLEARIAVQALLTRSPRLSLAVPRDELVLEPMPLWTRYHELPVHLD
ncbi:hypothetical protein/cytochrome P450 PksS [Pseudonocardia ammonioxydans]|uniref:Cytochrome P450 n=1 Tax=Pseudonocardia ammonioxydans TaxID=260086 RepID=A0A1I5IAJ6_PSUAM|nr:cytochrome P450 [Pseudonocardia ammonioxydans]SFO57011.1 hypothetical protein/cytochrome P450 PksS [Pseudonocardia ammonioxydans]